MSEPTNPPHVPPEAVGQERRPDAANKSGIGGYLKTQAAMWIVVIVVFVIFLAAILIAGVLD